MSSTLLTLATCSLNQWAMDFEGNYRRVKQSILISKQMGASYRLGPELELWYAYQVWFNKLFSGYGCNDHFYELDTETHCWEILAKLITDQSLFGLICDVGMFVVRLFACIDQMNASSKGLWDCVARITIVESYFQMEKFCWFVRKRCLPMMGTIVNHVGLTLIPWATFPHWCHLSYQRPFNMLQDKYGSAIRKHTGM